MPLDTIRVETIAGHTLATAEAAWCGESHNVSCTLTYPTRLHPEAPSPVRDALDRQFGIHEPVYGIVIDTISLSLDAERRLTEFDMYTNAERWQIQPLSEPTATPCAAVWQGPFDSTGRASEPVVPDAIYDPAAQVLCLSWGDADAWYAIAPSVTLGLNREGYLRQIRLNGLYVPEGERHCEEKPSANWLAKVRHAFKPH